jgi:hypothetical protein
VKNSFKIIGLLLVALFFIKSSSSNYNNLNEHISAKAVSFDENHTASIDDLGTFFCGIQNEIVTITITSCQTTDFKTFTINFSSIHDGTEKLLFSTLVQYISTSQNFIKKFRKSDIIFPFHYFW